MKGMRQKFQNKRSRPRQRPMGRIIYLNSAGNRAWRIQ